MPTLARHTGLRNLAGADIGGTVRADVEVPGDRVEADEVAGAGPDRALEVEPEREVFDLGHI